MIKNNPIWGLVRMNKLLIVEDDKLINDGLAFSLKNEGYLVLQAYNGEQAKQYLAERPNLIILDINLPDISGFELCQWLRGNSHAAVIFLTAKDTEQDIIHGFNAGGDDYIVKPFSLPVLKERVKAVLKRASAPSSQYLCGPLSFDKDKLILTKNGQKIALTATEMKLLVLLLENRRKVLTRGQIIESVWDIDGDFVDENALNVNIRRLRSKIEDDPSHPCLIKTVFGIGYTWSDHS